MDELLDLLPVLRRVPRRIDRIATQLERGTFTTKLRLFNDARDQRVLFRLVDRGVLAFLAAAAGIVSVLLVGTLGGPQLAPGIALHQGLGYVGLGIASTLGLRVLMTMARERTI